MVLSAQSLHGELHWGHLLGAPLAVLAPGVHVLNDSSLVLCGAYLRNRLGPNVSNALKEPKEFETLTHVAIRIH